MRLSASHNFEIRNTKIFLVPKHKIHKFECSQMFNHLPPSIKNLKIRKFEKQLKEILLIKWCYTIDNYHCDVNFFS